MAASTGLILAASAAALLEGGAVVRNQQQKAKSGATTAAKNMAAEYNQQKQDARNKNQAPDTNALNAAKQSAIFKLQQSSGRASTFLSNGLGG